MTRWPFTPEELVAIRAAYEALTRVGNATAVPAGPGDEHGGWDPLLDRAHHDLGLVQAMLAAEVLEAGE